jgi:hypothetical protein
MSGDMHSISGDGRLFRLDRSERARALCAWFRVMPVFRLSLPGAQRAG